MVMLKFTCKDVGLDCNFVAMGETVEEVRDKAFAHAGVVHADMMKNMSEEQQAQLARTVELNIKPA
jgi:predicted small metal-binding protein